MGVFEARPVVADIIGVPVFFIQETILENLGDGTVRVTGCMLQKGLYIPQYYSVMSCATLRRCAGKNALMAGEMIETALNAEFARH